jgi:hypothetical protein
MKAEVFGTDSGPRCSRRDLLIRASLGGLALESLSAAVNPADRAEGAEQSGTRATAPAATSVTDFERSCLRFRMDTTKKAPKTVSRKLPMTLNNVRMLLDARAVITHKESGRVHDYVLTASCKSEQVWVKRDIWHQPNADMCMLAGPDEFLVYKRCDKTDKGVMLFPPSLGVQPERQLDDPKECFDRFSINLAARPGCLLENLDAILDTLSADTPVVAQTEYETANYGVLLEYPVKVVNFSERERYYQVDTGPILLPDFDRDYCSLLEGCRLAYVAHNCPEWAEFIVCVPTPVTDSVKVHHYSKTFRIEGTRNRLIAVS